MSNDEVVKVLKSRIPQSDAENTTQDPAGEVEDLNDDELDSVAGGGTENCTVQITICRGTCCIPYVGGCCPDPSSPPPPGGDDTAII